MKLDISRATQVRISSPFSPSSVHTLSMPLLPSESAGGHGAHPLGRSQPTQSPATGEKQRAIHHNLPPVFQSLIIISHMEQHRICFSSDPDQFLRPRFKWYLLLRKNLRHCATPGVLRKAGRAMNGEGNARMGTATPKRR